MNRKAMILTTYQQAKYVQAALSDVVGRRLDQIAGPTMSALSGLETHPWAEDLRPGHLRAQPPVPLSRIVNGTIDTHDQADGVQHWTMGCHGSVGFLNAVLRVVNIPVQPVWICGHELAYFMTEQRYLEHGDDPDDVKNSSTSIFNVLIDEPTYEAWFTNNLTVNITDPNSPALAAVGRFAVQFPRERSRVSRSLRPN